MVNYSVLKAYVVVCYNFHINCVLIIVLCDSSVRMQCQNAVVNVEACIISSV